MDNSVYSKSREKEDRVLIRSKLDEIVKAIPVVVHYLENFTVHDGWLGASLFYCFYARYTDNEGYLDDAARYLNKALELTDPRYYKREYPNDSYDYRIASLGLFFRQVNQKGFLKIGEDNLLTEIDEMLFRLARVKMAESDYSRFSGALSAGHYFYHSDKDHPLRKSILSEIILGLEASGHRDADGDLYWTSPVLYPKVHLGCHGSAMIISFLAGALEEDIEPMKCREMLQRAAAFLIKQKRPQLYGLFPVFAGDTSGPTQFSQCFGDLGIGYSLFRAARAMDDPEIKREADHILSICLSRKYEHGHTPDAGITYGAAGVSHLFGRLARLSELRRDEFLGAESYWLAQIPNYAIYDNEFGGFRSALLQSPAGVNVSYGWGIIGIGISLMRYLEPDLPDLDGFNIFI